MRLIIIILIAALFNLSLFAQSSNSTLRGTDAPRALHATEDCDPDYPNDCPHGSADGDGDTTQVIIITQQTPAEEEGPNCFAAFGWSAFGTFVGLNLVAFCCLCTGVFKVGSSRVRAI